MRLNSAWITAQMPNASLIKTPGAYTYLPINAPRTFFSTVKTCRFCLKRVQQNISSPCTLELCKENGANVDRGPNKNTERLCLSPDKRASFFFFDGQNMPLSFKNNKTESIKSIYAWIVQKKRRKCRPRAQLKRAAFMPTRYMRLVLFFLRAIDAAFANNRQPCILKDNMCLNL